MEISREKIIEIIKQNIKDFQDSSQSNELDLTNVGMDSLAFVSMIVMLEDQFNCEIPEEKILISEMNTINKIVDVLSNL